MDERESFEHGSLKRAYVHFYIDFTFERRFSWIIKSIYSIILAGWSAYVLKKYKNIYN